MLLRLHYLFYQFDNTMMKQHIPWTAVKDLISGLKIFGVVQVEVEVLLM